LSFVRAEGRDLDRPLSTCWRPIAHDPHAQDCVQLLQGGLVEAPPRAYKGLRTRLVATDATAAPVTSVPIPLGWLAARQEVRAAMGTTAHRRPARRPRPLDGKAGGALRPPRRSGVGSAGRAPRDARRLWRELSKVVGGCDRRQPEGHWRRPARCASPSARDDPAGCVFHRARRPIGELVEGPPPAHKCANAPSSMAITFFGGITSSGRPLITAPAGPCHRTARHLSDASRPSAGSGHGEKTAFELDGRNRSRHRPERGFSSADAALTQCARETPLSLRRAR